MRHNRTCPEINAGSMADIAFLLLIFFLISATISNDHGIQRTLPAPCPEGQDCSTTKAERNILRIKINNNNQILVDEQLIAIDALKEITKNFLDNNGDGSCIFCHGAKLESSSDNPSVAVISLNNDNLTSYAFYIQVQDELTKAYYELREAYCKNVFNKSIDKLTTQELLQVKEAYPFILSEAVTK